jgi:hypothetical protein
MLKEIEAIFNRSGLTANIEIKELNIMLGLYGGEDLDVIFNTAIFISKWEIWKIRNNVKYNQSRIGDQTIFNTGKIILKNIYNAHYIHHNIVFFQNLLFTITLMARE